MQRTLALPFVSLAIAAACPAQTTWIVDINNGPGTNFTEIQPAVIAASPGDTIAIRAGNYQPFEVNRPLVIRGDPGVTVFNLTPIAPPLVVTNINAGETLSIHGVEFTAFSNFSQSSADITGNAGRVLLEDTTFGNFPTHIVDSEVWATDAHFPGLDIDNSTVILADCECEVITGSLPGIDIHDSKLTASRCTITGGHAPVFGAAGIPIDSDNSTLILTDDGTHTIQPRLEGFLAVPAISGTGTLLKDPNVVLAGNFGSPAIAASMTVTTRTVPSVRVDGAGLGQTLNIDVFSPAGGIYELFLGLPATPFPLPVFGGDLALGTVILPVQAGVQGPTKHTTVQINLINDPTVLGIPLAWQAIAGTFPAPLYLSNPDFNVLRP